MYMLLLGILLSTSMVFAENKEMSHTEYVFTNVYNESLWWTGETYSGYGSNLHQTQLIRQEIPRIIKKFKIKSMLDIPCGDFNWMRYIILDNIKYIGADVVPDLIKNNRELYNDSNRSFLTLDIVLDRLPQCDLILCRDCLVHFPYDLVTKAITNFKSSGAKYLLTTTFSASRQNPASHSLGNWHPLNLMGPPFNFPPPIYELNENCTEAGGQFSDKTLSLWRLDDLLKN